MEHKGKGHVAGDRGRSDGQRPPEAGARREGAFAGSASTGSAILGPWPPEGGRDMSVVAGEGKVEPFRGIIPSQSCFPV